MKIETTERPRVVDVKRIAVGDCFAHEGTLYMRVEPNEGPDTTSEPLAVALGTGKLYRFGERTGVQPRDIVAQVLLS